MLRRTGLALRTPCDHGMYSTLAGNGLGRAADNPRELDFVFLGISDLRPARRPRWAMVRTGGCGQLTLGASVGPDERDPTTLRGVCEPSPIRRPADPLV